MKTMSDHNKSSSSDESWQKLAIPYDEFDVLVTDIDEHELFEIGLTNEIEHLSSATFSSPAFPVMGWIYGRNLRCMVPLVCQRAGKPNSKSVVIWFLVDSGSPFTCLSVKSLESLFGEGNITHARYKLAIQDQTKEIECQVSKEHFQEVNILGMDAMQMLKLSIEIDWDNKTFKLVKKSTTMNAFQTYNIVGGVAYLFDYSPIGSYSLSFRVFEPREADFVHSTRIIAFVPNDTLTHTYRELVRLVDRRLCFVK